MSSIGINEILRTLWRRRAATVASTLSLACAIALFAATVSVLQACLFRPLAIADVDNVLRVRERISGGAESAIMNVSPQLFDVWRARQTSFTDMAAATGEDVAVQSEGRSDSISAGRVTANFFNVLGIKPQLGRDFESGEDRSGHDNVVLLSDETWRNRFNADPSIVGRVLRIDSESRTVIGVMPAKLSHPYDAGLWLPFRWDQLLREPLGHFLYVPARLRPGVSAESARDALDVMAHAIHVAQPELGPADAVNLVSVRDEAVGALRPVLWMLFGGATFVLLVATLNAATAFYAQGIADRRATQIRVALGARAGAFFWRALSRAATMIGVACLLGLLAASRLYAPVAALSASSSIREFDNVARLDLPTIAWIVIAAVAITGVLAWLDTRQAVSLGRAVAFGARGASADVGTRRRLSIATTTQCALAFMIAAIGVMASLSYFELTQMDRGFRVERLLLADLSFPSSRYPTPASRDVALLHLLDDLRAQPDVENASSATLTPDARGDWSASFIVPGNAPLGQPGFEATNHRLVAPGYFATMGMTLLSGRDFDAAKQAQEVNSAVVSHSFAEHAWPNRDAIGKTIVRVNSKAEPIATLSVIGVVADVVESASDPFAPPKRSWYLSTKAGTLYDYAQMTLAIRSRTTPAAMTSVLRDSLARVDPELAVARVQSMPQRLAESLNRERFSSFLYSLFAVCALLIALSGLYGALAFMVESSRREFGVRLALGARARQVLAGLLGRGLTLAGTGVLIGAVAAIATMKLTSAFVAGVSLSEAWALLPLAVGVLALAAVAAFIPAQRASRVDPIEALRSE